MEKQISNKVNELAKKVMNGEMLNRFLNETLKSRIVILAGLACMAGEEEVANMCGGFLRMVK